jgi:hypothetical protein
MFLGSPYSDVPRYNSVPYDMSLKGRMVFHDYIHDYKVTSTFGNGIVSMGQLLPE